MSLWPHLVTASPGGRIRPHSTLKMIGCQGGQWLAPAPGDLVPLPPESEIFLLPGRHAAGMDEKGRIVRLDELAVAAFAAPGYTLGATPAYYQDDNAPLLPLFAYGAVGFARGKMWLWAARVDEDTRQQFAGIKPARIENNCRTLLRDYPQNRLVGHIVNNCVRKYDCPAARNFALGRHEAPLPSSRACNARCLGCISAKDADSPLASTPQCRMDFTPDPTEIVEVMTIHQSREKQRPIYSFGQGCEGDPLINTDLLAESIALFRKGGGRGTVNCNSNASRPDAVARLADAGLTSLRVSLNSARPEIYKLYYRPLDYNFSQVEQSIRVARRKGVFVSLNLLYFPGITDTRSELETMADLCGKNGVSMIQWRNLNIDPAWYFRQIQPHCPAETSMGLNRFLRELRKRCPWLRYGYFNPYLGEKAQILAPMPINKL